MLNVYVLKGIYYWPLGYNNLYTDICLYGNGLKNGLFSDELNKSEYSWCHNNPECKELNGNVIYIVPINQTIYLKNLKNCVYRKMNGTLYLKNVDLESIEDLDRNDFHAIILSKEQYNKFEKKLLYRPKIIKLNNSKTKYISFVNIKNVEKNDDLEIKVTFNKLMLDIRNLSFKNDQFKLFYKLKKKNIII